jgi:hypothetical protein
MPLNGGDLTSFPANPKHSSFIQHNWFYPDGSSQQFDLHPRYVLDEWSDEVFDGVYDVPEMPRFDAAYRYNGWTNWVDKFSKDVRFSSQSDKNARATLFPEVRDPWMYTEYLYQGSQVFNELRTFDGTGDEIAASGIIYGIVAPEWVDPTDVAREFITPSGGGPAQIKTSVFKYANNQPPTYVADEHQVVFDLEPKWSSSHTSKTYWQSELEAMGWEEVDADGNRFKDFTRTNETRRVVKYAVPVINSGVRIYREAVFSESTRWGQSQNVPERTINLTGPPAYFKPEGLFTGRIVPKVKITWGVPLYDVIPDPVGDPIWAIKYNGYGSTAAGRIGMFSRPLSGGNDGDQASIYTYALVPTGVDLTGAVEVQMPRDNTSTLQWNDPNYHDSDIVQRGCAFFKGSNGQCKCTYYYDNIAQYQAMYDHTEVYTSSTPLDVIFVPPYFSSEWKLVLTVSSTNNATPQEVDRLTNVKIVVNKNTQGAVASISVVNASTGVPLDAMTLLASPGAQVNLRFLIQKADAPVPHRKLCGVYYLPPEGVANGTDYSKQKYREAGGRCSHYTPQGIRVVGSYQAVAANGAEWANMQRGLPANYKKSPLDTAYGQTMMGFASLGPIGGGVGGLVGAYAMRSGMSALTPDPFTSGLPKEDNQRIEIEWVPEQKTLTGKSQYYNTFNGLPRQVADPAGDIRIDASTGFYAIDDHDLTPLGGVDTTFYGMVNQNNYRIMHSVQHCYRSDKCNPIITSPNGNVGWRRGWFGGIDFTNSPLRMAGYPAGDGKDENGKLKHCFTGNTRCPYNNPDRRAFEFKENFKLLLSEILRPFRNGGIGVFEGSGLQQGFLCADGKIRFLDQETFADSYPNAMCVAVRVKDNSRGTIIGHWQPYIKDEDGNEWRVYFYYDRPSWDPQHQLSMVAAHIVQFNDNDQPVYMAAPTGKAAIWDTAFGGHDQIPWLIVLYDNYQEPSGNLILPTNSKPFAGGRAPEYKDRSKLDRQILCYRGGISDNTYRTGATDSNQFGGPSWNRNPVTGRLRVGYWIDEDGEWILDGRKIGYGEGFVDARSRMRNKPIPMGNKWPVDGTPGITIQDPDDPNSSTNRKGDWATVGWTYSNDTKAFLDDMINSGAWESALPPDPDSDDPGAKIHIIPPNPNMDMLPRERFAFHCNTCGIDFPEEEVNYLTQFKDDKDNLIYPLPSGAPAGGKCGCPRHDGGTIVQTGSYTRFMKCYARGEVDVWAPPGTTVRHDAYFWKNPTLISRAHKDQLLRKLGVFNKKGGGYQFNELTNRVEQLGRLPATTARSYQVGIARQIIAPWATPGETVKVVRDRVNKWFHLHGEDVAFVMKPGDQQPTRITDENAKTLEINDIVQWWRETEGDAPYRVGLPVAACASAPDVILNEDVVTQDTPMPVREDYDTTDLGDRQYQSALQKWLIGVCYGSIQYNSTSVYAQANAWAEALQEAGVGGHYGESFDPNDGELELDERFIEPYGQHLGGGLKLITLREMKRLRNRIIPTLAYDLNVDTYTAGGDFTDRAQADHLDRFSDTRKPLPFRTYGSIPPQVLAANTNGVDAYLEWETGDLSNTKARAFLPTGQTWWRLNQLVGCIKRQGGTNYLHLDQSGGNDSLFWLPYTGDNVKSVVAMFLHGRIPMDKEILGAYLIYSPGDAPDFEAIGCQGQYTGNVYTPFPLGDSPPEYAGGEYCFWMHYHGYTTNHEKDHPWTFDSLRAKQHVELGHPRPQWFNEQGTQDDPNQPWLLGDWADSYSASPELQIIDGDMEYKPFVTGGTEPLYTKHIDILEPSFEDVNHGFDMPQQGFLGPWSWGQDLTQIRTEHEIWKDMTFSEYSILRDRYHVNYRASVNTDEAVSTGEYFASYFRDYIWAREQQGVSGWLKMGSYESSGWFDRAVQIEEKIADNDWANQGEVLLQEDSTGVTGTGSGTPGGGRGANQAGSVEKVVNITNTIRHLYNDRVARFYTAQFGLKYTDLYDALAAETDTNVAFNDAFHQDYNDPWFFNNYRYFYRQGAAKWGMWLTDPWHCPPMLNDSPIRPGDAGDPIPQASGDRKARVVDVTSWDTQGLQNTDANYEQYHPFSLLTTDEQLTEDLPPYNSTSDLIRPAPQDPDADHYWRVLDNRLSVHQFTMDLRQMPYEKDRRNWRYQAPRTDSTNATCPNVECFVHDHGWTVGQFIENSLAGWGGYGIMPSASSDRCANCHTLLEGVLHIDGDGIVTVAYDTPKEDDALISAIEVKTDHASFHSTEHHGFTIEYFNTIVQQWRTLFSVTFDNVTNKWGYQQWDGTQWAVVNSTTLPSLFKGVEGANGNPKNTTQAIGSHFVVFAAAKIRFKVTKPIVSAQADPVGGGYLACTPNVPNRTVQVAALTQDKSKYNGRTIWLRSGIRRT